MTLVNGSTAERLEMSCPECSQLLTVSSLQVSNKALVECLHCGAAVRLGRERTLKVEGLA